MVADADARYEEAMADAVALGLLTASGVATNRCQCPTCANVFSTEGNFTRHLVRNRNRDGYEGPWCRRPGAARLVQTSGVWHQPGSEDAVAARRSSDHAGGTVAKRKRGARA